MYCSDRWEKIGCKQPFLLFITLMVFLFGSYSLLDPLLIFLVWHHIWNIPCVTIKQIFPPRIPFLCSKRWHVVHLIFIEKSFTKLHIQFGNNQLWQTNHIMEAIYWYIDTMRFNFTERGIIINKTKEKNWNGNTSKIIK